MNQSELLSRNIAKALAYRNELAFGRPCGNPQPALPCSQPCNDMYQVVPCNPCKCPTPCPGPCPPPCPGPPGPPGPPGQTGPSGPSGPTTAIIFDGGNASSSYVLGPTFDCGTSG